MIAETINNEIPVYTFWQKIHRFFLFWIETFKHPKKLVLTQEQAEYIESLFMGGSDPEAIARAMNSRWGRETWLYFQTFDDLPGRFVFKPADFEVDGLEYLWSAMQAQGALVKKKDGLYYQCDHPMVKKLAGIAVNAPVPQKKEV